MQILFQGPNRTALGTIMFLKVYMQQISSKSIQSDANYSTRRQRNNHKDTRQKERDILGNMGLNFYF
jgi:hypothetical protein